MATVVLRGSALMTGHGLEKEWGLKMENGRISQIGPNKELIVQDQDQVMELKGQIILPDLLMDITTCMDFYLMVLQQMPW